MMRFLILLAILVVAQARVPKRCRGTVIHNIKHEQEILQNLDSPFQLAIDYDTNIVFFSYSVNTEEEVSKSAYVNLKTNELATIPGISGGFANAVDAKKHIVYLGGSDGIFNFNFETKEAVDLNITDNSIWQLFFKDDLYYTTFPEEEAYVVKDGEVKRVPELSNTKAKLIAIDNNKNIYFSNSSGLFVHEISNAYVTNLGNYSLNSFTADKDGNLYFSTLEGLYSIKPDTKNVELLASFDYIYGMVVEADGTIIYSSDIALIRLKPTKTYCPDNKKKESV